MTILKPSSFKNFSISLHDMMGRIVKTTLINARKGSNVVKISPLEALPSGSYIIEMIAAGERVFKDVLLKNNAQTDTKKRIAKLPSFLVE